MKPYTSLNQYVKRIWDLNEKIHRQIKNPDMDIKLVCAYQRRVKNLFSLQMKFLPIAIPIWETELKGMSVHQLRRFVQILTHKIMRERSDSYAFIKLSAKMHETKKTLNKMVTAGLKIKWYIKAINWLRKAFKMNSLNNLLKG